MDAVFAGHPSFLAFPKDLEKPVVPTSIAVAEFDHRFDPKVGNKVKQLWEKKSGNQVKTEIVVYKGVKHGFCVRGDMKNEQVKDAITKAVDQVWISLSSNNTDRRHSIGLIRTCRRDCEVLLCSLINKVEE